MPTTQEMTAAEYAMQAQASATEASGYSISAEGYATNAASKATLAGSHALTASTAKGAAEASAQQAQDFANAAGMGIYRVQAIPVAPASLILNPTVDQVSYYEVALTEPMTTINLVDPPDLVGFYQQVTLTLKQGSGANKVTWPSKIKWAFNRSPVLNFISGYTDVVTLVYRGSGKWMGVFSAGGFNEN